LTALLVARQLHTGIRWLEMPMLDAISNHLERYMSLLGARQKLVAANIANADTPGYKTLDIDFKAELQRQMEPAAPPSPVEVTGLDVKNDGNNVSLDREARLLAENAIRFNIAAQILRSQIHSVKSAIEEGRSG
jgi:flagellar basal-body rod protein FlgB